MRKEKEKLERKIEETIRILSCMYEGHPDMENYQNILNFYCKDYREKYGIDYKKQEELW